MEPPAGVGGPVREGGGPLPSDGPDLSRPQGHPVRLPPLRRPHLPPAVVLRRPLPSRPAPQLQVSPSSSSSCWDQNDL